MDYHLPPITRTCAASGEELKPGTPCYSVLVEENGRLVRRDYSPDHWSGPPPGALGYWKSTVPAPKANRPRRLDAESLMRYFEQLDEDANPSQEKILYVLALLLLQKRRLEIEGTRQEGETEYLQLVGRRGEGPFEVRNHRLTDEEVEQLSGDLNSHLATEWS